jgi:hypothetical protein
VYPAETHQEMWQIVHWTPQTISRHHNRQKSGMTAQNCTLLMSMIDHNHLTNTQRSDLLAPLQKCIIQYYSETFHFASQINRF